MSWVSRFIFTIIIFNTAGCTSMYRKTIAERAKANLEKMTVAQVLGCMGIADRKDQAGQTEIWEYSSGLCRVNIFLKDEKVLMVKYFGYTTSRGSPNARCYEAVVNCTKAELY